jgi:hypothetical protein
MVSVGLGGLRVAKAADPLPKPATDTTIERTQQPSPEMQTLTKAIVGRWTTTNAYGSPSSSGAVYHGEQTWRSGPGGFTLLEEEHGNSPSGEFFLLALHWWDNGTHTFKGMLCNNSGASACNVDSYFNSSVKWDGKQLVIDLDFLQAGKKMRWHEIFGDFTPDSFTQTGDIGEMGATLRRFVTIHAKRIAEAK